MDLAAPKIMFISTYLILYSEIMYIFSIKGNNPHAKIIVLIASNFIKLSSSYTGRYLVAKIR